MTEIGTRSRTTEEENQTLYEVGVHLGRVSALILSSVATDQWCLLDWEQIDSYVKEQMEILDDILVELSR